MGDISAVNGQLVGLFAQIFCTGIYYVYFTQCISILRAKSRRGLPLWLPIACAVLFVLATGDFVVALITGYEAFGIHGGNTLADPTAFFANVSSKLSVAKGVLNGLLMMLSDVIIVYRTFVVWNYDRWVMVLPLGLLLSSWAVGIWSSLTEAQTQVEQLTDVIAAQVTVRTRYFFILTFVLNILCATLICWRVWNISSRTARHIQGRASSSHVISVVVETAALYCALLLALIVTDAVGTNAFYIFLDALPPINAIVFSLLIVRSRSREHSHRHNRSGPTRASESMRASNTTYSPHVEILRHSAPLEVEIHLEEFSHKDSTPDLQREPARPEDCPV